MWPRCWRVTWLCGCGPLILNHHPVRFGAHRSYGTGKNGVCCISSNSNSNADVYKWSSSTLNIIPPFVNLGIGTLALELKLIWETPFFSVPLGLWTPKFAGWWLRMRETHPQSHVTPYIMVTWQIKNVISLLSRGLWSANLAGWWPRTRWPHLKGHVTHQPNGHVTNQKRYISTFSRPMDSKLSRLVT